MPEFEIKIKTPADVSGLKATRDATLAAREAVKDAGGDTTAFDARIRSLDAALNGKTAAAARAVDKLKALEAQLRATGQSTDAVKEQIAQLNQQFGVRPTGFLDRAGAELSGFVDRLPGVGRLTALFNGSKLAIGGVATALFAAKKGVEEFAQAQDVWAGMDAALAQTGQLTDTNRARINAYAGDLQNLTGIADDTWTSALQGVIQFGGQVGEIDKHADAIKNYAGLLNGDVAGAAEGYKRALSGNFMMFTRLGFEVDANASKTQNLTRLWEFLAQRGGGQLEARGKTLSGQWLALKNSVGDLFEAFGRWMAQSGVLQSVLYGLGRSAAWLAEKLGGVPPALEGLQNAQKKTVQSSDDAAAAADGHATAIDRVKAASDAAKASLDKQRAAAEQLAAFEDKKADLQMAIDLEKLKGRTDLTPAQKTGEEQRIRAASEQRKAEAPIQAERAEIERQQAAQKTAQDAADKAAADAAVQAGRAGEVRQRTELEDRRRVAWAARGGAQEELETFQRQNIPGGPEYTNEEARIKKHLAAAEAALAQTQAALDAMSPTGDLGSLEEENKKLADMVEARDDAIKTAAQVKAAATEAIQQSTVKLQQLGVLRTLTGEKSTEEAANKLRDAIEKAEQKVKSASAKAEGKNATPEDAAAFAAAQAELEDYRREFQRMNRQPVVPPPSVPAAPPSAPAGFDARATRPPAGETLAPIPVPSRLPPPAPAPTAPAPVDTRGAEQAAARAGQETAAAVTRMGESTAAALGVVKQRLNEQDRTIRTLAAQIANGRTR